MKTIAISMLAVTLAISTGRAAPAPETNLCTAEDCPEGPNGSDGSGGTGTGASTADPTPFVRGAVVSHVWQVHPTALSVDGACYLNDVGKAGCGVSIWIGGTVVSIWCATDYSEIYDEYGDLVGVVATGISCSAF